MQHSSSLGAAVQPLAGRLQLLRPLCPRRVGPCGTSQCRRFGARLVASSAAAPSPPREAAEEERREDDASSEEEHELPARGQEQSPAAAPLKVPLGSLPSACPAVDCN